MSRPMEILSLGAGVQSTTVLLMSITGALPPLDAAIFADTMWEPPEVYEHLAWLALVAGESGLMIHRVSAGDLRADAMVSQVRGKKVDGQRWASMPLHTKAPDGKIGIIRRQCTKEYKIQPIDKKIRELLGYKPRQRMPAGSVCQWFGISNDEMYRVRSSDKKWKTHFYPLIFANALNRPGCHAWLERRGYPEPPRSACIGCPFHSNAEWRRLSMDAVAWADAVAFDNKIRNSEGMKGLPSDKGLKYECYLHYSCVPLEDIDFRNDIDRGQTTLWNLECTGMCGV